MHFSMSSTATSRLQVTIQTWSKTTSALCGGTHCKFHQSHRDRKNYLQPSCRRTALNYAMSVVRRDATAHGETNLFQTCLFQNSNCFSHRCNTLKMHDEFNTSYDKRPSAVTALGHLNQYCWGIYKLKFIANTYHSTRQPRLHVYVREREKIQVMSLNFCCSMDLKR